LRMLYGDNILIETLLQEFIVNHAELLLVVVGNIKRDDQKLIRRIKGLAGKRILVIHNLMDTREVDDIQDIIQEDIIDTFNAREKPFNLETHHQIEQKQINQKVYIEQYYSSNGEKQYIEHIIFANESSNAGEFFNASSLSYIKRLISGIAYSRQFDLVQSFYNYAYSNLENFLTINLEKEPLVLETDNQNIPSSLKLTEPQLAELKLSSVDELGHIRTFRRDNLENIPYTVKIIDVESEEDSKESDSEIEKGSIKYLRFEFEITGKCREENIKYKIFESESNDSLRIMVKGACEDDTLKDQNGISIFENTRKFGDFALVTQPIPKSKLGGHVPFRGEKPEFKSLDSGLKTLTWKLYKEENNL